MFFFENNKLYVVERVLCVLVKVDFRILVIISLWPNGRQKYSVLRVLVVP